MTIPFFPHVCYLEGYFTWLSTVVDTTQVNPVIRKPDRYERHYLYFSIFTPVWFSEKREFYSCYIPVTLCVSSSLRYFESMMPDLKMS